MSKGSAADSAHSESATQGDRPVTYRELFANRQYSALYTSIVVSWIGDYLSRAAVTVLVYQRTHSALLAGVAFIVGLLPWISGTFFAALADRFPYRRVMITCDLVRMVLVSLLLIPGIPIPALLGLVFLASLAGPPSQAARSALTSHLVDRRVFPLALATQAGTSQALQVFGYFIGAALAAALTPRIGLAVDVVSFAGSAAIVAAFVRPGRVNDERERRHLLREVAEGFTMVFGRPDLRIRVLIVFATCLVTTAPEGLAAGWAADFTHSSTARGFYQGLIMAAGPVGFIVGSVVLTRVAAPALQARLMRPLIAIVPIALIPVVFSPPIAVTVALVAIAGLGQGAISPILNAQYVQRLPPGFRARALSVAQVGLQLSGLVGVVVPGWLASTTTLSVAIGLWSVVGLLLLLPLLLLWPGTSQTAPASQTAQPTPVALPAQEIPVQEVPLEEMPVQQDAVATVTPEAGRPAAAGTMEG